MNVEQVYSVLNKQHPQTKIALGYSSPLDLLIATILSAQCTDDRVNKVTKILFKKYKNAKDYAYGDIEILKQYIRSTGFFNAKAKNIQKACKIIVEQYNGKVPDNMDNLTKLPGVGRKTANIVLANAYGQIEGMAIDTHMKRVNFRMGFTKNTNPDKIEQDLIRQIPKEKWNDYTYLIIEHGRKTCKAPIPLCSKCTFNNTCPKKGVINSK